MIREFAEWLAATQLSALLQNTAWVVPTSQSIHIASVGIVMASAFTINLRLLGGGFKGRSISELAGSLIPWMWRALAVLATTGAVQITAEPSREFVTPVFWAKMVMVLVVSLMTTFFARRVRNNSAKWDEEGARPTGARSFAIVTSLLWIAIVVCGRFIGYTYALYL